MTKFASLALLGALMGACQPQQPAVEKRDTKERAPDVVPAANMSHGEAPVGGGTAPAQVNASAPPRSTVRHQKLRLDVSDATVEISPGVKYAAWTFGGDVPGPFLRATVGDTVDFTLVNSGSIPHSMDFHAAEIAPDKYYVNISPKDSVQYRFIPRVAGVFMYHCGTAPVAAHIANGMYGAFIIDPQTPRPTAREFVLVQSEFYLTSDSAGTTRSLAWEHVLSLAPDFVVFNGRAAQYATHPIIVQANELVRLYVVNAGPNRVSSFHVVGGIFERVFADGSAKPTYDGVQTVAVPVGGGAMFEIRLKQPGDYPFVTHAFADATKGAVGILRAQAAGK